jgi:hypothetical protein
MGIGSSDGQYYEDGMALRMGLGSPTEPAGALKSDESSETPDKAPESKRIYISPQKPDIEDRQNESVGDMLSSWVGSQFTADKAAAILQHPRMQPWQDMTAREPVQHTPLGDDAGLDVLGAQDAKPQSAIDKLLGVGGDRYQLWPERAVRGLAQSIHDVIGGDVDLNSEEGIRKVNDVAGALVMGPAPVAKGLVDGTLGSFAGVTSKTIDKTKLYEAQRMQLEGVHPDEIWQNTGFFQGADKRWRYEISDENALLRGKGLEHGTIENNPNAGGETTPVVSIREPEKNFFGEPKDSVTLPDVLHHPELYEAYPNLKNVKVEPLPEFIQSISPKTIGSFSKTDNTLYLKPNLDPEYARSIVLHEIQHKIQDNEGFARGGNQTEFTNPEFIKQTSNFEKQKNATLKEFKTENNLTVEQTNKYVKAVELYNEGNRDKLLTDWYNTIPKEWLPRLNDVVNGAKLINKQREIAFEKYKRLMGEVEARNVQTRRDFSDIQRWMETPHATEDKPRHVQIEK